MRKLGASLSESQAAIREFQSDIGSSTHPPKRDRLLAISTGWQDANSLSTENLPVVGQRNVAPPPSIDNNTYIKYMQKGAEMYKVKKFKEAYIYFSYASDGFQSDTTASLYTGIVAHYDNDNASALKYFNRFINQGGKDVSVFYTLSELYKNKKEFGKAFDVLNKGIITNPRDNDLKSSLINLYLSNGMMNDAIEEMKRLIESTPNTRQNGESLAENFKNLGTLYENQAEENSKKVQSLEIENKYKNENEIKSLNEKITQSKELAAYNYKKALEIDPNNYDANYNITVFYFNQAVVIKGTVDKMDMKTYNEKGKMVEEDVCGLFNRAKIYFDKCKSLKSFDQDLIGNLKSLEGVLEQCRKRK